MSSFDAYKRRANIKMIKSVKNFSFLWIGAISNAGFSFLLQVIAANLLSVEFYGLFASTLAMLVIASSLSIFGVQNFLIRAYNSEKYTYTRWVRPSIRIISIGTLCCLTVLFTIIVAQSKNTDQVLFSCLVLLGLIGNVSADLGMAFLQIKEKYIFMAFWQFALNGMRVLFLFLIWFFFKENVASTAIAIGYAIASLLNTVPLLFVMKFNNSNGANILGNHSYNLKNGESSPSVKFLFLQVWPYGVSGLLFLIYYQVDIILIKHLKGNGAAAIYSVAFYIIAAIYIFPSVLYQKFLLPKLHRWLESDVEKLFSVYRKGHFYMLLASFLPVLSIFVFIEPFIKMLYKPDYYAAINIVFVLSACIPLKFISTSLAAIFLNVEQTKVKACCMLIATVINIAMNLLLIPYYSYMGAAVATIITEFCLVILFYYSSRKLLERLGHEKK